MGYADTTVSSILFYNAIAFEYFAVLVVSSWKIPVSTRIVLSDSGRFT